MTKTAQEYRDDADASARRAHESRLRDDDGWRSEAASDLMARLSRTKADLIDAGKVAEFAGLFDGERRLAAKIIPTQYGSAWLLTDDEIARYGRTFIPTGKRSRVQKDLGLHEADETAPAWATNTATSVYTFRTDGGYPGAKDDVTEEEARDMDPSDDTVDAEGWAV